VAGLVSLLRDAGAVILVKAKPDSSPTMGALG